MSARRAALCKHVNLLDSLLDAIVRLDGDALVMHVGEKPYVVTTSEATNEFRGPLAWGQVELSTRLLTTDAVAGMLGQILPLDHRSALDEDGATEYVANCAQHPDERFTIVAARGGDDIWIEMRRHSRSAARVAAPPPSAPPAVVLAQPAATASEPAVVSASEPSITGTASPATGVPAAPPAVQEAEPEDTQEDAFFAGDEEAVDPDVHLLAFDSLDGDGATGFNLSGAGALSGTGSADGLSGTDSDDPDRLDIDLDRELEPEPFTLDADVEAGLLAATQEWGDDVMTEGELGELLRATAAAVITGETLGVDSGTTDWQPFAAAAPDAIYECTDGLQDEAHALEFERAAAMSEVIEPFLAREPATLAAAPAGSPNSGGMGELRQEHEIPVSRRTRELPALVQYQLARDRAAAVRDDGPREAALVACEPVSAEEPDLVHLFETPEPSVATAEGVLPVHEDVMPQNIHGPTNPPEAPPLASGDAAVRQSDSAPGTAAHAAGSETASAIHLLERVASEQSSAGAVIAARAGEETREGIPAARPAGVVLPLTRAAKGDAGADGRGSVATNLQRLLRLAANRGAGTVYVVANTAPLVRVDGEFSTLEGEAAISPAVVERLLAEVAPPGQGATPPAAEWLIDVPEIGRVRCLAFRDHRGPGLMFRMVPSRAISADQLGLSAEVQAFCSEADGLVLVTGGRASGKSTLLASFVDLINRTRSDHIVTVETEIEFVHEGKRSFVSQREVRGEEAMAAAVRGACREEPDVLVVEDVRSHEVAALAMEAAEAGRLVFASVPGLSASSAIERLIELFPADRREKVQASLAATLRGVISQVLLRKLRGGRVAAREVLLNTPPVTSLIIEGKTFQLAAALESGRCAGMMSFADSLASLVREGTVHPSHACRKAPDREQLAAALRRDGVDMSLVERLG